MIVTRVRCLLIAASIFAAAVSLSACDGGRERPPSVSVRVVHALSSRGTVEFRRVNSTAATLNYLGESGRLVFDEDEYDFNVYAKPPNQAATLVGSFTRAVDADYEYLFALAEIGGLLQPVVLEKTAFDGDSTAEVNVVHAGPDLPAVDVYVEPNGTDLATATPLGEIVFGQQLAAAERTPGDYRLFLTSAGEPGAVMFTSAPLALNAGNSLDFVITGGLGNGLTPISAVVLGDSSAVLIDQNGGVGTEMLNAAADQAARDIYIDEDYTAPLFGSLAYAQSPPLVTIAPGARMLSVTPAGNPGVVEDELAFNATLGLRFTGIAAGEPGSVTLAIAQDDPRRVIDTSKLRFINGASQYTPLEYFVVTPGTDITNLGSLFRVPTPGVSSRNDVAPGDYELIVRDPDTNTVVSPAQPITLESGGLYTVLTVNGSASGTVDVNLLEDFVE